VTTDPSPSDAADLQADPEVARTLKLRSGPPRWPWIVGLVLVVLLAVASGIGKQNAGGEGRWDYDLGEVARGDLTVRVTAVGTVQPRNSVAVSSELSGIVASVAVELDDRVKAGQVLAKLDASVMAAQQKQANTAIETAQAGLSQAEVQLRTVERTVERSRATAAQGALAAAELEQAEGAYDAAHAAFHLAEAQLAQARAASRVGATQLRKTVIRSPIDGIVLERNVEPGQAVVSALQAQTLFVVADDLEQMEVEVEIDEADIGRLKAGQAAEFTVAAHPDRVFPATVRRVHLSPKPGLGVVTYLAELDAPNPDGALRPGMTATARIDTSTIEDAVLVPNRSLRWAPPDAPAPPTSRDGRRVGRVWTLVDGEPVAVEVLPGLSDGRSTVIEPGAVSAGQEVVVDAMDRRQR
jgi:HlyD family secretion protein